MCYHSRILFIVQRVRYTHPHGTPSGYHRREQVQRHADSERIGEQHLHIQQHPPARGRYRYPPRSPCYANRGKEGCPRNTNTSTYENSNPAMPLGNISSMFSQKTCPSTSSATPRRPCVRLAPDTRSCILEAFRPERFSAGTSRKRKRATPKTISVSGPNNCEQPVAERAGAAPLSPVPPAKPLL